MSEAAKFPFPTFEQWTKQSTLLVHKWTHTHSSLRAVPYWLGAVIVGLAAVIYTKLFDVIGGRMIWLLKVHPYWLLFLSPVLFVLSRWLVQKAAPSAAGSGIPQVMAVLEKGSKVSEPELSRLLGFRVLLVKIASSLLCLLGGGVIGREGPTIQVGASLYCTVHRRFGRIVHQRNPVPWIITGSAAGLAAAFNTPLGGIVFAIEELASIRFGEFKAAVLAGVIIAGMIAQWMVGPYLYLGFFQIVPATFSSLGWVFLVAILCGLTGAFFGKVIYWGSARLRNRSFNFRLGWAALCGITVVALGIVTHANALLPGASLVKEVLTNRDIELSWPLVTSRYIAMRLSYLSGCAGGIFAPSLAMGSAIGGHLAAALSYENLDLLSIAGMAGFLSAVTRAPFTSAVLVLEMTDCHSAVFPIMCASILADAVAYLIDRKSFYRKQMLIYMAPIV